MTAFHSKWFQLRRAGDWWGDRRGFGKARRTRGGHVCFLPWRIARLCFCTSSSARVLPCGERELWLISLALTLPEECAVERLFRPWNIDFILGSTLFSVYLLSRLVALIVSLKPHRFCLHKEGGGGGRRMRYFLGCFTRAIWPSSLDWSGHVQSMYADANVRCLIIMYWLSCSKDRNIPTAFTSRQPNSSVSGIDGANRVALRQKYDHVPDAGTQQHAAPR